MPARPNLPWWTMAVLAASLSSQACSTATSKAPTPPPTHQARQAHEAEEQEPYHVAPPPAYGNKVVLARSAER